MADKTAVFVFHCNVIKITAELHFLDLINYNPVRPVDLHIARIADLL
ncbi:hypothetical protein N9R02_02100 [Ascidiaceihabitans sp.]|nr:hypothetical protein [Ascidiaceihabitans sp.]